uniref:Uncharacterized protein n=1 Tax=Chenopodium quinoa TaxID=63459 RepID=A0A803MNM2_CHEQI
MTRCGVCLHNVKTGQGTAIFTAECSHSFHFPCITALAIKNNGTSHPAALLCCPLCGSQWKEAPFLGIPQPVKKSIPTELRLYDDDEPLVTHVSSIQFNPIPESEEENEDYNNTDDDFPGFFSNTATPRPQIADNSSKGVQVTISPESAVIAVGRSYETYAVLLTVKAPPFQPRIRRPSVDVVAVIDIGGEMNAGKLHALKRGMRAMISSLSSNDRLSMVVFSSTSKRLLPLRRMTPSGRRSARRIIDAINLAAEGACLNDALRKAAKVIQDRKEKNHFAAIVLMDGHDDDRLIISSTRFSEIPVHTFKVIYGGDQTLSVPRPHTIRSSEPKIQRLRSLFVMTRAVAESRRLVTERNDLVGAERLLASARAVLSQPSLKISSAEEYRRRVEAELAEVKWRRQAQPDEKRRREKDGSGRGSGGGCCVVDEKGDPLTPTSAWKAAERLAKVAMMRKNLNRVSDLHGFEDARF